MQSRFGILTLFLIALAPVPGVAEPCAAAAKLARIHDAYVALDDPGRKSRVRAAIALLALDLSEDDPALLGMSLAAIDPPPDEARMARVLRNAQAAAEGVTADAAARLPANYPSDIAWLAETIGRTGCDKVWPNGGPTRTLGRLPGLSFTNRDGSQAEYLTYTALVAVVALCIAALRRTRMFRQRKLRRQPRNAVSIHATVTFEGSEAGSTKVLDLAQGGMKIALRNAPAPGVPLAVEIDGKKYPASIAWRNDFYAGLLLDTPLSISDMSALLTLNASRAGGRPTQASK